MSKVLIVDDEKNIRLTLNEFLKRANYDTDIAEDAETAYSMFLGKSYDVVLIDIIMPRVSGIDLLRKIREKSQSIQVIIMTGEPTIETAVSAMQIGANDYVFKPITKQSLIHTVGRAAMIKTLLDEKMLQEQQIRMTKSLLELMTKYSPFAVFVVDNRTDEILYFNHQFTEIWNITSLEGQMLRGELKYNDIMPHCLSMLTDVTAFIESCEPLQTEENRNVLEDEIPFINRRTVRRFTRQLRGDFDEYYGRYFIFEDITQQKESEAELLRLKEKAEAANIEKTEFLSNMSHEIRTPINAIVSYTQLLINMSLTAKQPDFISKIQTSSKILLSITNDILDFDKLESKKIKMESIPIDLDVILNNVGGLIRVKCENKGLKLKFEIEADVPKKINGDPLRLQQILTNLIDNAVKFTNQGEIVITVKVVQDFDVSVALQFSVSDTGIGMTGLQMEHLFKPFYQSDASTCRKYGGSGLGLAISKHLVELHGGKIWVESEEDNGTTFFFTASFNYNCNTLNANVQKNTNEFQVPDIEAIRYLRDRHVLVVEDNEINQDVLVEILQTAGMVITVANNGEEALHYIKTVKYDIVLMDIGLPDMDGYEITAKIRKDRSYEELPIVAVTAYAMVEEKGKCLNAHINDYVTKPISIYRLFYTMVHWIKKCSKEVQEKDTDLGDLPSPLATKLITSNKFMIPDINGIDIEMALCQLGGDQDFFCKLLIKFRKNQKQVTKEIRQALNVNDVKTAERLAHTVKGIASHIAAQEIYKNANFLENAIHTGSFENIESFLVQLEELLEQTFASIVSLERSFNNTFTVDGRPFQADLLKPLLYKLESLLQDKDIDAVECINEIISLTGQTAISQKASEMETYIDQYLFEEALIVLNDIFSIFNKAENYGI